MFSLSLAHTHDFLQQDEIIAASATIQIVIGLASIFGPILVSVFMHTLGPNGFFIYLFIVHIFLGLFGLYRMAKRAKPQDLESLYVPLPRNISSVGMELNPKIDKE